MGELQERITSTKQGLDHLGAGHLRAGRRPHRPGAGDHLRPPRRHHRALARHRRDGHLPGRRPARLDLAHPRPARSSARSTTTWRARVQEILQRYKDLQDIIAILGMDELSEEDKLDRRRAPARSSASSRSRSSWPSSSPACPASTCRSPTPSRGFKEIVDGKHDDLPEQAFFMVGGIDEAVARQEARRSRRDEQAAPRPRPRQAVEATPQPRADHGRRAHAPRRGRHARRLGLQRRGEHGRSCPASTASSASCRSTSRWSRCVAVGEARVQLARRRRGSASPPASATCRCCSTRCCWSSTRPSRPGRIDVARAEAARERAEERLAAARRPGRPRRGRLLQGRAGPASGPRTGSRSRPAYDARRASAADRPRDAGDGRRERQTTADDRRSLLVRGGRRLAGEVVLAGAKNSALKLHGRQPAGRRAVDHPPRAAHRRRLHHGRDAARPRRRGDASTTASCASTPRTTLNELRPLRARAAHARQHHRDGPAGRPPRPGHDRHAGRLQHRPAAHRLPHPRPAEARRRDRDRARLHRGHAATACGAPWCRSTTRAWGRPRTCSWRPPRRAARRSSRTPPASPRSSTSPSSSCRWAPTSQGAGTSSITIEGGHALHGAIHEVVADRIEAGTYLLAGVADRRRRHRPRPQPGASRAVPEQAARHGRAGRRGRPHDPRAGARAAAPGRRLDAAAPGLCHRPAGAVHGGSVAGRGHVDRHRERLREPLRRGRRAQPAGRRHRHERPPRRGHAARGSSPAAWSRRPTCAAAPRWPSPGSRPRARPRCAALHHIDRGYEAFVVQARRLWAPTSRASRAPARPAASASRTRRWRCPSHRPLKSPRDRPPGVRSRTGRRPIMRRVRLVRYTHRELQSTSRMTRMSCIHVR